MAIKISGSTIIDDSRQIINAGNAGIGTTNPSAPVTAANTGVIAAGVGTFHKVYGDGSELINIGLGGTDTWNQDAQGNLVAGVGAGVKRDADTCSNLFIGCKAGAAVDSGDRNIFLGYYSAKSGFTSGNCNIAIGDEAGICGNGSNQVFLGSSAGYCMSGSGSIAIGMRAGQYKTSGLANVFIGCYAGGCAGSDGCTTVVGALAGKCGQGGCNAIFGSKAGFNNTSGDFNTFLGYQAACSSTSGSNNVAIGNAVQVPSLTGDTQLAIGAGATTWLTGNDTFKVGIGTTTYTASLNVHKDIGGYQVLSAEGEGSTTLEVKTITKTAKHRYPGGGGSSTSGYTIDGAEAPYLTLTPGRTYRFEQSDSSNNNHPLIFYLEADKTTEYTAGVSYYADGAQSTSAAFSSNYNSASTRYTEITVSDETPLVLHYQCYNHGYMGNAISFPNNVLNTNYQSTIRADLHVTGIATFGSASLKLDGTSNIINVGAALTLGHSQGIQYHTQNLHATGFEVNQINASGITTFTNVKVGTGATIESNGNATLGIVTATAFHGSGAGLTGITASFDPDAQENLYAGTNAGAASDADTCFNVAIGYSAGAANKSGDSNVFLGRSAGEKVDGGSTNVHIGDYAACVNESGHGNVAIGEQALRSVVTANNNVAIGKQAGCLAQGYNNTFLGYLAGANAVTGCCNVVIGCGVDVPVPIEDRQLEIGAGPYSWISGDPNMNVGIGTNDPTVSVGAGVTAKLAVGILTAYKLFGDGSGLTNITAEGQGIIVKDSNSLIGTAGTVDFGANLSVSAISGAAVTITATGFGADSQENLYAGTNAGAASDTDTCYNVAIGCNAGRKLDSGDCNVLIGNDAGCSLTSGGRNVFLGSEAGACVTDGGQSIFMGKWAGKCSNGDGFIFLGYYSGMGVQPGGSGAGAIYIGCQAGRGCASGGTSATCNIAIGVQAGCSFSSGNFNTFLGMKAGLCNNTGYCNVAMGYEAGKKLRTGSENIMIGANVADGPSFVTGSYNIGLGKWTYYSLVDGSDNIAIGEKSAYNIVAGSRNIAIGKSSGVNIESGEDNILIGTRAGDLLTGSSTGNIIVGVDVDVPTGNHQLAIGVGATQWISGTSDGSLTLAGVATANATAGILSARDFHTDQLSVTGLSTFTANVSIASTLFVKARAGYGRDQLIIGDESTHNEQIKLWRQNNGSTIDFTHDDDPNAVRSADILALRSNYGTDTANTFDGFGIDIDGDQIYPSHNFKPNLGTPVTTFGNIYATGIITSGNSVGIITYYGDGSKLQGVAGGLNVQDEGVTLATQATTLNFEGAGVVASGTGATKTITISGGGGTGAWSPDDDQNLYAGTRAGRCLDGTNGCFNVLLGCNAGQCTDSGAENIFVGRGAGYGNEGGDYNIFLGSYAGKCNTTGYGNVLFGKEVAFCLQTGIHNFYALERAGSNAYQGCDNIAIGRCAGYEMMANDNVLLGRNAGRGQVFGSRNVIIGMDAGRCGESGDNNVMIGCNAGRCNQGTGNVFLGHNTGSAVTSASGNVVIGCNVSLASSVQDHQLAIGVGNTNWITGIENYNLGIGSDRPRVALDVAGTVATRTFFQNEVELRTSETFPKEGGPVNGGVFGPYTIGTGACLTIGPGSTFTIIGIP